jgi:hypothetical protein
MTEANNAVPEIQPGEMVEITSIPQFAGMVAAWHGNVVAQIRQAIVVPDEVEITVTLVPGTPEATLSPEERKGFKAGLIMALSLIEQLPFQGSEDAAPAPEALGDEGTGL